MNRRKIEEENKETAKFLRIILNINGIAFVLIMGSYVILNILGLW